MCCGPSVLWGIWGQLCKMLTSSHNQGRADHRDLVWALGQCALKIDSLWLHLVSSIREGCYTAGKEVLPLFVEAPHVRGVLFPCYLPTILNWSGQKTARVWGCRLNCWNEFSLVNSCVVKYEKSLLWCQYLLVAKGVHPAGKGSTWTRRTATQRGIG